MSIEPVFVAFFEKSSELVIIVGSAKPMSDEKTFYLKTNSARGYVELKRRRFSYGY